MKRLVSVIILTSILAFGALNAAMGAGFSHFAASMEGGASCMDSSCSATGNGGTQPMDCISHCVSAASTEFPVSPLLPVLFVVALLLLVAGQRSLLPVVEGGIRNFTDVIGRLLLRQRLATVVLRN